MLYARLRRAFIGRQELVKLALLAAGRGAPLSPEQTALEARSGSAPRAEAAPAPRRASPDNGLSVRCPEEPVLGWRSTALALRAPRFPPSRPGVCSCLPPRPSGGRQRGASRADLCRGEGRGSAPPRCACGDVGRGGPRGPTRLPGPAIGGAAREEPWGAQPPRGGGRRALGAALGEPGVPAPRARSAGRRPPAGPLPLGAARPFPCAPGGFRASPPPAPRAASGGSAVRAFPRPLGSFRHPSGALRSFPRPLGSFRGGRRRARPFPPPAARSAVSVSARRFPCGPRRARRLLPGWRSSVGRCLPVAGLGAPVCV